MLVTSEVQLESIILHKVGNKSREEGLKLSKGELQLDGFVKELLMKYFLSPFKILLGNERLSYTFPDCACKPVLKRMRAVMISSILIEARRFNDYFVQIRGKNNRARKQYPTRALVRKHT